MIQNRDLYHTQRAYLDFSSTALFSIRQSKKIKKCVFAFDNNRDHLIRNGDLKTILILFCRHNFFSFFLFSFLSSPDFNILDFYFVFVCVYLLLL